MTQIFHQNDGDVVDMVATAAVTSGDFIDVDGKLGVALISGAIGETITVKLNGVVDATKASAAEDMPFGTAITANSAPTNTVVLTGGDIAAAGVVVGPDSGSGTAKVYVKLPG